jgi:RND family efflux transporter MFP subunit
LKIKRIHQIIMISAACAMIAGCGQGGNSADQQEEKSSPVQVQNVEKGSLKLHNDIYGIVSPNAEASISPKLSGELLEQNVHKNQYVEQGTTLAVIDHESLSIQLKMEEYSIEQALEQYRDLHVSQSNQTQLDQALRSVEQAKLRLQLAELNVRNAYVTAPISGIISAIHAVQGETVSPGAPLYKIVSLDPVHITANVSTNQMMELQHLKQIPIEIPDLGQKHMAQISYMSQVSDSTGFYAIEAELANPELQIKPGMTARIVLEQELVNDALLVPTKAIVDKGGLTSVFLIEGDKAVEVRVDVLETQSDISAIAAQLEPNAQIVVKGQMTLSDGQKVSIIEEAQ